MKHFVFSLLLGTFLTVLQSPPVYAQKVLKAQKTKAQRPLPGDDDNPPPAPLPPGGLFVGEWEWVNGGEVFHLTLTRNPAFVLPGYPNDPPSPAVIGQFVYTRNGVVVDQSLTTGRRPYAALGSPTNNSKIKMLFYEHGTKGFGYLTLTFLPNNPNALEWLLIPRETAYRHPADRPAVPFLVPTTMTLTR